MAPHAIADSIGVRRCDYYEAASRGAWSRRKRLCPRRPRRGCNPADVSTSDVGLGAGSEGVSFLVDATRRESPATAAAGREDVWISENIYGVGQDASLNDWARNKNKIVN